VTNLSSPTFPLRRRLRVINSTKRILMTGKGGVPTGFMRSLSKDSFNAERLQPGEGVERVAQRVVVRGAGEPDGRPQVPGVGQQGLGPAVAQVVELPQGQAGEQLREREVPAAERAGVLRQVLVPEPPGDGHHVPGRAGAFHPASCTRPWPVALPNTRRTAKGSGQSKIELLSWRTVIVSADGEAKYLPRR
jgi:hypothetical protein